MENSFISSLQLAVMVLEVFYELFEDVTLDTSLYRLAVDAGPIYNTLMENVEELDFKQCSGDDAKTTN